MIYRRGFLKGLIAALPLGAAVIITGKQQSKPDPHSSPEAFQLDLEKYRRVDPALAGYREEAPLAEGVYDASAMALAADGVLYVAAGKNVYRLDGGGRETVVVAEGKVTAVVPTEKGVLWVAAGPALSAYDVTGPRFAGPVHLGERGYITSLAYDGERVFAADAGQRTVWILGKDGALKGRMDGRVKGSKDPGFVVPSPWFSVAASADDLWVVNPGRQRVERYTEGRRASTWGFASMDEEGFCGCCNPTHLALLPGGGFVTSEKGIPRVKVYDDHGKLRSVVAGADVFEDGTTGLALAAAPHGRILVLDPVRGQVRSFVRGALAVGA